MFEREKLLEPLELCLAECGEVGIGFGTTDDRRQGDEKNLFEGIMDGTSPSSRVVNFLDCLFEFFG